MEVGAGGPGRGCRCCRGEAVITPISQMRPAGSHGSPTLGWAGAQGREPAQALRCPSIRAPSPSHLAGELPAPHTRPSGQELQALLPASRATPTGAQGLVRTRGSVCMCVCESPCLCVCVCLCVCESPYVCV